MPHVVLTGVRKTYRGARRGATVTALDGLDLAVADGELMAVVGPSGCGKTTMLRIIAGLETPDAGAVRIAGRDVDRVPPERRDVAMVFQNGGLYPHLTVRGNLEFPLRMRRVPASERAERVERVAELVHVEALLDRRPGVLSGGERQRVALAKAMVREPACFLLDEPLASLDLPLRLRLRSEIKSLHGRLGRTMIHVTHDQEEALALGDRLAVISSGRVQQVGAPLEVYRRPANRIVAGFVGALPMNLLDGALERVDGQARFRAPGLIIDLPPTVAGLSSVSSAVTLGVRPEWMRLAPRQPPGIELNAVVELVQPIGERVDLVCMLGEQRVVARVQAEHVPPAGATVTLHVNAADVCLFEPGAEGALLS